MTQRVSGFFLHVLLSPFELFLTLKFFVFLKMSFYVSKLIQQGVMLQDLKVFKMKVCLIATLWLSFRFSGIDSFQNAESPEVLERNSEFSDGVASGDVLGDLSLGSSLDFLPHNFGVLIIIIKETD